MEKLNKLRRSEEKNSISLRQTNEFGACGCRPEGIIVDELKTLPRVQLIGDALSFYPAKRDRLSKLANEDLH